ncbi:MAG: hypothetical protein HZA90_15440 [Verrucomicrobia bacterium]|nr:hypothetical protein [Verrucomicrobiota bacterium]
MKTALVMYRETTRRWAGNLALGLILAARCFAASAADDRIVLTLDQVPRDGVAVARVDLAEVARWCGVEVTPARLRAFAVPGDQPVPAQFVPDEGSPAAGTILLRCDPAQPPSRVRLDFAAPPQPKPAPSTTVRTRWYSVTHDAQRLGGLPAEIVFAGTDMKFYGPRWNDRLYHRQAGQFWLRYDRQPKVECVSTGAICTVVRVSARYSQPDGKRPESQPAAVYDWYYFHDQPLVYVRAVVSQQQPQTWHEAHFLELGFPTNRFSRWAGGEPLQEAAFRGNDQSHRFNRGGAIIEGRNVIGMFDAGAISVYDGAGYGRYLHAQADAAWQEWKATRFERSAWLLMAADDKPAESLSKLAASAPGNAQVIVSTERLQQRLDALRAQLANTDGAARREAGWQLAVARLLQKHGRLREALELPAGQLPSGWKVIPAGDLRLILEQRPDGLVLLDLADASAGASLLGADSGLLFELTLRHTQTGEEVRLSSDRAWSEVAIRDGPGKDAFTLRWAKPQSATLGGLAVTARVRTDAKQHRLAWSLDAQGQANPWSIWWVRFPQLALSTESSGSQLLLPQAAGVLKPVGRERLSRFHGQYPSGWMSMQLAALYDPAAGTGLYFGLHDPVGATKDFFAESVGPRGSIRLAWEIPAPDMGRPGNRFTLSGEAVWQLLRGDWFDAALIYRDWARRESKWFPKLGAEGRADTPPWMRELSAWAQMGGTPKECVPRVLAFAKALGVPVGFHWYSWHQIPFDNDYPHYFPTKDGFADGVKELQAGGVHVMPYINGRLWDTHDRGTNDFEFTRVARPAATKNTNGEPYVESYGSKESNGQPVRLAVMCPTTRTWRERQHDIVMRLFNECGVQGVYIDQIAAAKPELCFDATHGHPLGGGSWWNGQGYWPLLDRIRQDKPRDRMLTTECNAEPFLRWFDGYLTWHWQYDGQVPLFPAVYGGAVQMFGRAYRGGPTKDLALRMKATQQLVWGEQLGWLDPSVVREPENFAFFRDAVQLRWKLRRYFHAGQMARPPKLAGDIPNVTADWQWSGVWPVTTPAVMTGAWHLPTEKRLVLLFANVSDQAITAPVQCDLREAGLAGKNFTRCRWTPQGETELMGVVNAVLRETVTFPSRSVWAWEITAKE